MSEEYDKGYNDGINEVLKILQRDLYWYKNASMIDAHVIGKNITQELISEIKDLKI